MLCFTGLRYNNFMSLNVFCGVVNNLLWKNMKSILGQNYLWLTAQLSTTVVITIRQTMLSGEGTKNGPFVHYHPCDNVTHLFYILPNQLCNYEDRKLRETTIQRRYIQETFIVATKFAKLCGQQLYSVVFTSSHQTILQSI